MRNVNREKVVMSWQIGKEIESHLKENKRAGYGEELFKQLTKDAAIEKTTLYQMHSFYKTYPKLPDEKKALSWSHYRNLIAVKDAQTRAQLEDLVVQKNLGTNKLQQAIGETKKVKKKNLVTKKLRVTRGKLFTYSLTKDKEVDLGFNVFVLRASCVVLGGASVKIPEAPSTKHEARNEFTYVAELERVVDGDTIHVKLDLGFGIKHREILRLAKINAAEAETKEGKRATVALKKILKDVSFLVVKTSQTDIYGRYIADVFFGKGSPEKVAAEGEYLNQLLLDRGVVELY